MTLLVELLPLSDKVAGSNTCWGAFWVELVCSLPACKDFLPQTPNYPKVLIGNFKSSKNKLSLTLWHIQVDYLTWTSVTQKGKERFRNLFHSVA